MICLFSLTCVPLTLLYAVMTQAVGQMRMASWNGIR